MPLEQALVFGVNSEGSLIETLASVPSGPDAVPVRGRAGIAPRRTGAVLAWCARRETAHGWRAIPPGLPLTEMLPGSERRDLLAAPLDAGGGRRGILLFLSTPGRRFGARDLVLAQSLLEPFSAAMAHDRELRDLTKLRETAEAEKKSLLDRLGSARPGDTIIGAESGLHEVMDRVALVSGTDAPVLIFGETGSGKEVVARAIHNRSPRAGGPFIRVNCGAIPPEMIDSELFGHEQGAFTGAVKQRKGWFERADGGTLLLDEVAELTPAAQVRLLRVLQDGRLERVGGQDPIHVSVRIIAATHRDLAAMVAAGSFREDLWYRIAVFPLVLPPLRNRRDDIEALARHFAERAAVRFGLPVVLPSAEDVALLASYAWPGNIRELAAVIDRAAILGDGARLEVRQALGAPSAAAAPRPAASGAAGARDAFLPLDDALRQHIASALRASGGRIEGPRGAAALLRVNPNTLRGKMRRLGIRRLPPPANEAAG
ncbi:MAG: sigma-54-dependent Fis family transcriptional regulator [Lentisphaerae bacterium]|nr:sigma-54-dependent Fis family transcriptional regulator [Lentisphaerota bacterium]